MANSPVICRRISQATFVLAVCLFAAAMFMYSHARSFLMPLLPISVVVIGLCRRPRVAVARFSSSAGGAGSCLPFDRHRCGASARSFPLGSRRNRSLVSSREPACCCIWTGRPISSHLPSGFDLMVDMLLGLSMLLVVFDDSQTRTRRLGVINALTTQHCASAAARPHDGDCSGRTEEA